MLQLHLFSQNSKPKVVNSREVREVVEGTTCISDKKLSFARVDTKVERFLSDLEKLSHFDVIILVMIR